MVNGLMCTVHSIFNGLLLKVLHCVVEWATILSSFLLFFLEHALHTLFTLFKFRLTTTNETRLIIFIIMNYYEL